MNKTKFMFLCASTALVMWSCGDSEQNDELAQPETAQAETKPAPANETFFQVPSPGEMLTFIKMVGDKQIKNISFLNPTANEKKYADAKSKAVNFGIYSCDLSYCSIFEIGSESLKYFKVVKTLGEQIGVSTAIKPEILKRLEANIGKPDSLAVLTDDVYFSSFEALEAGNQGPTLAMVIAGGWIESMYIASNLMKFQAGSLLIDRIADQKYTLENLVDYMKKYEEQPNIASVKKDFEALLAEFNKIPEEDVAGAGNKDGGKVTIGGGKQLKMDEATFKAIVAKVAEIRNSYTQTTK